MSKYSINFFLWTAFTREDGSHTVKIRINKDRKNKYISLKLYVRPEYWNEGVGRVWDTIPKKDKKPIDGKKKHPEGKKYNELLNDYLIRANKVIKNFEEQNLDWTLNQFEDAFLNKSNRVNVEGYIQSLIDSLQSSGRTGNAKCYSSTLKILKIFDPHFSSKIFSEIDLGYVKKFDEWLQKPRETVYVSTKGSKKVVKREGCSGNTRKYYIKALRAIFNKAIEEGMADLKFYPFGKTGFNIAELEKGTAKRYLPADYLAMLKTTQAKTDKCEFARKLFLLSYYCFGMSFVDLAHLKKSHIKRGEGGLYIEYVREKVKRGKNPKMITIKITDEISKLMDELAKMKEPVSPYLIPIVSKESYSGEQLYNHIRARYKRYSVNLVALADELGIEGVNLTSYVSRHTMAMTLQNNEVSREKISQIMGHKDLHTTIVYLDGFNQKDIDEATKVL